MFERRFWTICLRWLALLTVLVGVETSCSNGPEHDDEAHQKVSDQTAVGMSRPKVDQWDVDTQRQLGLIYLQGEGIPPDEAQAAIWFRKAADQGDRESMARLHAMHLRGAKGARPDSAQANGDDQTVVSLSRAEVDPWDIDTQRQLGQIYQKAEGIPADGAQAVMWFRKAADQGDRESEAQLGAIYLQGAKGVAPDKAEAIVWMRKAAKHGDVLSAFVLGHVYAPTDGAQAMAWFTKAAELGSLGAELILANNYLVGRLVPKDEAQAVFWYRKAAERENAESQFYLGTMYAEGRGVPRDMAEALAWLHKAADKPGPYKARAAEYIERIERRSSSLSPAPTNLDGIGALSRRMHDRDADRSARVAAV